jgi:hypothetical protein
MFDNNSRFPMSAAEAVNARICCKHHMQRTCMRLYYEAIKQRVSTVKGPFYIGFLCLKVTCLQGPQNQIHMRTAIILFDLIGHRAIDRSQKVDTIVKQVPVRSEEVCT